jgi:hypothetical protein
MMNQKDKYQFLEFIGYFIEVAYFVASGFAFATGYIAYAGLYLFIGFTMSFVVGKLIIINHQIRTEDRKKKILEMITQLKEGVGNGKRKRK